METNAVVVIVCITHKQFIMRVKRGRDARNIKPHNICKFAFELGGQSPFGGNLFFFYINAPVLQGSPPPKRFQDRGVARGGGMGAAPLPRAILPPQGLKKKLKGHAREGG